MDEDAERGIVEVRDSKGVIIGDGNTQINYTYNAFAVTGGVAPAPLVSVTGTVESPYRGLNSFEYGEEAFFFGRDTVAEELTARLAGRLQAPGIVVVSGSSGAGKSSLIRAGVLPRLRAASTASAQEPAPWPCLVITPTRTPLDELAVRVAPLAGTDAAAIRRGLAADPQGFALTVRQAAEGPQAAEGRPGLAGRAHGRRLVLVVDQFEELFMQCPDEDEDGRRAFIAALHSAATTATGSTGVPPALVVLVVRADFETRCARYELLADAVQHRYLLMPMTSRQLRLAITGPALIAGSHVEDDLVGLLIAETHSQANALPLLSYALDQAWRSKAGDSLRLADYERIGGMEGSVAASAERAYTSLSPAQRVVAQQVFMRLTTTNDEGQVAVAPATRAELEAGASADDVSAVLEAFADKTVRLIILEADSVSISHEVLLTAWDQLREWLQGDLEERMRYARLKADARTWNASNRASPYLYSAGRLDELEAARSRWTSVPGRYPPLDEPSVAFVNASKQVARASTRRRRAVVSGLAVLSLTALMAAGVAWRNGANANHQRAIASEQGAIALSRQLAADSLVIDPTAPLSARQLAIAAWRVAPTAQAANAVAAMLAEQQQEGLLIQDDPSESYQNQVAFSPNGKLLATADAAGNVHLWNPATDQPVGHLLPSRADANVNDLAFSPDGKLLATADDDGTVRLWDPATGHPVGQPLQVDGPDTTFPDVNGVAFNPNGSLLATADGDGTVRLWDPATGRPEGRPMHADTPTFSGVNGVAFSPSGKLLASADDDGSVRLWDPSTGRPVGQPIHPDPRSGTGVSSVAFSPNGKLLATADDDGTVRLWNPATGQSVGQPLATRSDPTALAFSPDGDLLAAAENGGDVQMWNPITDRATGPSLPVSADGVAFSPDGTLIATADSDGNVRLWNPATGRPTDAPLPYGPTAESEQVAFSPDGNLLATYGGTSVQLWNPATGSAIEPTLKADSLVEGVAFSPDGKLVAAVELDDVVQLWNAKTGLPDGFAPKFYDRGPATVAFSPDGKLAADADAIGDVQLWNPSGGKPAELPLSRIEDGFETGIAFSPTGSLMATISGMGSLRLWNTSTRRPSVQLSTKKTTASGGVYGVAFSPNGKLLATADANGYVQLWNPSDGQPVGAPIPADTGSSGGVSSVAFSPNGKLLATADANGYVQLWNPSDGRPVGAPIPADTGSLGGVSSVAFSPNGKLLATADANGYVQLWRVSIFTAPYEALCADVGVPSEAEWVQYAPRESRPSTC